uniref:CARD domain-containing protein n=1 Tax=Myotis lucifugus TaxID=59463 RepID=G1Q3P6_MYOLU
KKLLEILQQDLDSILDSLTSQRLISEDEYEALEDIPDPLNKSRKLLILVQKKGEDGCQHFLKCLFSTFSESATTWSLRHEFLKHENIESPQSTGVSKNSEDLFSPGKKQPESSEITVSLKEKEHLDVETSEMFMDKKSSYGKMAWSLRKNEKSYNPPTTTIPHSVENVESEVSGTIDYSQDQQRYNEPDDSLYLGEDEYLESAVFSEDVESTVEGEDHNDLEYLVYGGEEDLVYSETAEFSGDEQSYGDSEPSMPLEEEEEESMEERKKMFKDVLSCLNLDRSRKLLPDFVKSSNRGPKWTPETPGDLALNFLMKVQALEETRWRHRLTPEFAASNNHFKNTTKRRNGHHPEPQEGWLSGSSTTRSKILRCGGACGAGWRLRARLSVSIRRESQALRQSKGLRENPPFSQEPVAVASLHGDLESFWTQFGFLMEVSSVFFFTDCLGPKEWDLLMFLGEDAIERCYFILSPQARESEGAQIFQRILKLKPSQLLFWEEEEAGEKGRNLKGLRAALQEVMSSSLRCVSVEDMAFLARELGIQIDQDFENVQGIQVSPGENLAGTVEDEGQQRHSQKAHLKSPLMPMKEPGAEGEVTQALQNFHLIPVFMPYMQNLCSFPVRIGGHFNCVPVKAPRVTGFCLGSEQKSRWFHPPPFQISGVHSQYFQPQRFCSVESFMKFSRPAWGHHMVGPFGRPPRPIWLGRPQTTGACARSAILVSLVGHFHSQPAGPVGKPPPRQAHARGTQPPEATAKLMRTLSHTVTPHSRNFQPAGVIHRPLRPAFQQGFKLKQGGPSNPAGQMGSHPMSNNRFLPNSLFRQPTPPPGQAFPPMASQPKPTKTKPTHPQPSQARCSPSKPTHPQPSQARCSLSKPTQPPRPTQPKSSEISASQAKASYLRAGPKRGGKH